MLLHVLNHVIKCSEVLNVTELVHLIVADNADTKVLLEIIYILAACAHYCNACAGESDL